jgi:hypothetical protein
MSAEDLDNRYQGLTRDQLLQLIQKRDRQKKLGLVWERDEIEADKAVDANFVAPRAGVRHATAGSSPRRGLGPHQQLGPAQDQRCQRHPTTPEDYSGCGRRHVDLVAESCLWTRTGIVRTHDTSGAGHCRSDAVQAVDGGVASSATGQLGRGRSALGGGPNNSRKLSELLAMIPIGRSAHGCFPPCA